MRKLKLSLKKEIISDLEAKNVKGGGHLSQEICYPYTHQKCPAPTEICEITYNCRTELECYSVYIKCKDY
ncbi:MAG: hypothetical protein N4A72_09975 [Bacteroidales bacterium]|jgi:hypothetical protein|nr:hypothetical protein [Bacteroidales bacterium]